MSAELESSIVSHRSSTTVVSIEFRLSPSASLLRVPQRRGDEAASRASDAVHQGASLASTPTQVEEDKGSLKLSLRALSHLFISFPLVLKPPAMQVTAKFALFVASIGWMQG